MIGLYRDLIIESVRQPTEAARRVFAANLSREILWTGLALAVVLSTLIYALSLVIFPPHPSTPLVLSPTTMLIMLASGMTIFVFALFWGGRAMGGKEGRFGDVLASVTWLQFLHLAVQGAALVVMFVSPYLASLGVFAANLFGIWILAHFLNEAFRFGALSKAFFLLVATVMGLAIGLTLFLTAIGVAAVGIS